ncbi:hypothetical protein AMATHDRAFT_157906 [Amanita thiersii Skay4041]|uniref:DNA damage-responsive protein 48 n=1 Tax=Amanita thiersii Skay4041 TaxID=703135 RepID=A0A2A9NDB2_9AGAR|nr:hypothetical protein AMATHDRAFT_157906 [Amanita thiersii Skay4041]
MDFLKGLTDKSSRQEQQPGQPNEAGGNNGGSGGFMGSINNAMGGGEAGEKKEDYLDKAVDFVQERMGGGKQDNESAFEQAKDEQISDAIRRGYKGVTGSEFSVKDKS